MTEESASSHQVKGKNVIRGTWNKRRIKYVAGEIIVCLNEAALEALSVAGGLEETTGQILSSVPDGSRLSRQFDRHGIAVIEVPEGTSLIRLARRLSTHHLLAYAEPNIITEACQVAPVIPNEYANLAALGAAQWGLENVRAPWAWRDTTASPRVLIAVVDSGIAGPERAPGAIYRWHNLAINDHFYTPDPLGEWAHGGGYNYEGCPFQLFPANTPNTVPFFRWWNVATGDHFYTTDPNGEIAPQVGYVPEGDIGNIAPAQIAGTTALHRWFHPGLTDHFYTTDPNGELAPQLGYQSEGIAGYVNGNPLGHLCHPDLVARDRFILGYDHVHDDGLPADDHGHGTHVAGIAAADTDNGVGIAGMAWLCRVLVIKVFDRRGRATTLDLANAIREAVSYGVERGYRVVINYSGRSTSPSETVERAIKFARERECLVVASTGNDSRHDRVTPAGLPAPLRRPVGWPAAYSAKYENVIAVGGIDVRNNLYNRSNVGPEVSVVAPGVNVRSTVPNYPTTENPGGVSYLNWDGTSMAAPHVSGLAALLWTLNDGLSARRVREIIETTADDLGAAGKDDDFGHGRINCERAVAVLRAGVIHRWFHPAHLDHFYTPDPHGEIAPQVGYVSEGAPFRLFPANTAGTTPFFRWFHPGQVDHFYTTDPNGEIAPQVGYVAEGIAGYVLPPN